MKLACYLFILAQPYTSSLFQPLISELDSPDSGLPHTYRHLLKTTLLTAQRIESSASGRSDFEKSIAELSATAFATQPLVGENSNFVFEKFRERFVDLARAFLRRPSAALPDTVIHRDRLQRFRTEYPKLSSKMDSPVVRFLTDLAFEHKSPDLIAMIIGNCLDITDEDHWTEAFAFAHNPNTIMSPNPEAEESRHHIRQRLGATVLEEAARRQCAEMPQSELSDEETQLCPLLQGFSKLAKFWSNLDDIENYWMQTHALVRA